jgi:flagellar hook-associated protein 2
VLARLSDLGITSDRAGKLTLSDATKLEAALSAHQAQVEDIFGGADGVAARVDAIVSGFTGTNGALEQERNLLNSRSKRLTDQIARIDTQLKSREIQLRNQYARLTELVTQLTGQQVQLGGFGTG